MRRLVGLLIPVCALAMACGGGGGGGKAPTATPVPITTLYVRTSGNDDNTGVSPDTAFKTIARATQLIGPGVTVYVGAGTYDGTVAIRNSRSTAMHPIQVIADAEGLQTGDPGEVTIDARNANVAVLVQSSPSVTVDGFTITGVADDVVVNARSSDAFTIRNCIVRETASVMGIRLESANDALIFNNVIAVDGGGVRTVGSQGTRIISNTILTDNIPDLSIGSESSSVTVRNNIIDSDRANVLISVDDTARATYDADYNLVFAHALRPDDQESAYRPQQIRGEHDINEDALLLDENGGQYQLQPESPAVDAGNGVNVETALLIQLGERSTAEDGSRDGPPVDLGFHYPAAE